MYRRSLLIVLGVAILSRPATVLLAEEDFGRAGLTRAQFERFLPSSKPHPFQQREHAVLQLDGEKKPTSLPAEMLWISRPWNNENAQMPYLVYMPEKDRLLMLVECHKPTLTAFVASDDHGKTWSSRRWLSVDEHGKPNAEALGLTYLGAGKLIACSGDIKIYWCSSDYGQTWEKINPKQPTGTRYGWDPLLVVKNANGGVMRLVQPAYRETGKLFGASDGPFSQASLLFSSDEGRTWGDEVVVPQWLGISEVSLIVARNGDWVAACRTDNHGRFARNGLDQYSGLGVCISKDQGRTWSSLNTLYEWGRHQPHMVLLPDGRILMTYVVRNGYPTTREGLPQFGVEAVVSQRPWADLGYGPPLYPGRVGWQHQSQPSRLLVLRRAVNVIGLAARWHAVDRVWHGLLQRSWSNVVQDGCRAGPVADGRQALGVPNVAVILCGDKGIRLLEHVQWNTVRRRGGVTGPASWTRPIPS